MQDKADLVEMTAEIVSAYLGNNSVPISDVPALIETVFGALESVETEQPGKTAPSVEPAVPIKQSVTADFLICLEDGKQFKSLKRHLRTHYNLSPEEYRRKWGLPVDYPMVAPNYAAARSKLAKEMGLGQKSAAGRPAKKS
ncbi:MAG: MucR family transcriptional regulator [Rhodobiaceae bacterium]|nr:MAG: MucR family transcriptional regulator [Rhodobiaceae bacterium]